MPCFIGPLQIMKKVGEVDYRVALLLFLSNIHDIFHVSQLMKYIPDLSHVIQVEDVHVRENLTVETSPLIVEDREVKHLRGGYYVWYKFLACWGILGSKRLELPLKFHRESCFLPSGAG
ncbi:uncharacterized protein LOC127094867 [Lathyrus oleraceus]|uniref:uncharacterized protein LOC127094867 n=1 Tax=Pisum sativum TaxID=3888 RepID=UPI0021D3E553|nr:uncharacterized protein LOC127094867 [Pisum sativum]